MQLNENKYYTPDIEDLHIGYECEYQSNHGYESFNNGEETWHSVVIGYKIPGGYSNEIGDLINGMDDGYQPVRTLHLTKEQIKAEGWEWREVWKSYFKGNWSMDYIKHLDKWRIRGGEFNILHFTIPSINEFRKICKLLGI